MDVLTPQAIGMLDALSRLSVVAFFIVAIALIMKRKFITKGEKDDSDAQYVERLAEKDKDIAHERALVRALTRRLDRFQIVLERMTGISVPADPESEGD